MGIRIWVGTICSGHRAARTCDTAREGPSFACRRRHDENDHDHGAASGKHRWPYAGRHGIYLAFGRRLLRIVQWRHVNFACVKVGSTTTIIRGVLFIVHRQK